LWKRGHQGRETCTGPPPAGTRWAGDFHICPLPPKARRKRVTQGKVEEREGPRGGRHRGAPAPGSTWHGTPYKNDAQSMPGTGPAPPSGCGGPGATGEGGGRPPPPWLGKGRVPGLGRVPGYGSRPTPASLNEWRRRRGPARATDSAAPRPPGAGPPRWPRPRGPAFPVVCSCWVWHGSPPGRVRAVLDPPSQGPQTGARRPCGCRDTVSPGGPTDPGR
jgi:hypothetical protein